ncbi:MAG TPA: hypothetical protein DCS64_15600, partial [Algoriphagus sp.]|nr:hypothetical protein [Algoriphagus sp.]
MRIFPNATVFVNILMLEKSKAENKVDAVAIEGNQLPNDTLYHYFSDKKVTLSIKAEEVWKIGSAKELSINKRIEDLGKKLKDWKGIEFFRGITSGFNEAFHLNKLEAKELIEVDKKNSELLK